MPTGPLSEELANLGATGLRFRGLQIEGWQERSGIGRRELQKIAILLEKYSGIAPTPASFLLTFKTKGSFTSSNKLGKPR